MADFLDEKRSEIEEGDDSLAQAATHFPSIRSANAP